MSNNIIGTFGYIAIILLVILLIVRVLFWKLILIITLSLKKFPARFEFKPALLSETHDDVIKGFNKISESLKSDSLEKVGDFTIEGLPGYVSVFKDDNEKLIVTAVVNHGKKGINAELTITTYSKNGARVVSSNSLVSPLPSSIYPMNIYRRFPDCMPIELLRIHKEYISNHIPQNEREEIPINILEFIDSKEQELNKLKLEQGKITRDKDERYYRYSFSYSYAFVSNILKQKTGGTKKRPYDITDVPYARGFSRWINPRYPNADFSETGDDIITKDKKANWWKLIWVAIVIYLIFNPIKDFFLHNKQHMEYTKEWKQTLYSFGKVQGIPLIESLERIEKWMKVYNQPAARSLNPGLTREQISEVFRTLPFKPTEELYTLYSWHNGQEEGPGTNFTPTYDFLSLESAVKDFEMMRKTYNNIQRNLETLAEDRALGYFFPFFTFEGSECGALCGGYEPGKVMEIFIEEPLPICVYLNITLFMQEIAEYFETGAYYISDEGALETDTKKERLVLQKYHPSMTSRFATHEPLEMKTEVSPGGSKKNIYLYSDGLREIKYLNSRGFPEKEEFYRNERILKSILNRYDEAGRIVERDYFDINLKGDLPIKKVLWDYSPDEKVIITQKWNKDTNIEIIEAIYGKDGKWRILSKK